MTKAKAPRSMFSPERTKLLVRRKAEEVITKGGLYKPETAREKPQEGTIVASHADNLHKVGEVVLYGRYAGTEIELNNEVFLILSEDPAEGHLFGTLTHE